MMAPIRAPLGFTLEDMAELLEIIEARATGRTGGAGDVASDGLRRYLAEARARRQKLEAQLAMADEFIERLTRLA